MARKRKSVLNYESYNYMPEALKTGTLSHEEMRSEYTRLRKVANERLRKLKKAGMEGENAYRYNVGRFPAKSTITKERDLIYALYEVSKFVQLKTSTVAGAKEARRAALETLRSRGVDFVNAANLKLFGDFMEAARRAKIIGGGALSSERVVELFSWAKREKVNIETLEESFAEWKADKENAAINKLKSADFEKGLSADELKKLIKR